ncbi:Alkylated DNA repair dioxygenase AlkB [Brazilian cedratvirus IHUMI]|uniref:Alkylated DNA repair dioxygenase AlkB n=1 Tax=Brazilian cedratvirus IHUMI TaxID=2126980 RepID=A0A2R8FEA1_9VIRU|nr:Alkylated DNA repair dioxygenase AlkB [Brazilian cedratvirus IHUMI]
MSSIEVPIQTDTSRLVVVKEYTNDIYEEVKDLTVEEKPIIYILGKECRQRRDVGFYSDESKGYKYSGAFMASRLLTPFLKDLLLQVNQSLQTNFNGILVNIYRTGEDYLSAHSDNEDALDKNRKMVAGLSYGATRKFRIRNKETRKIILDIEQEPGTLIVMEGNFQAEFLHEIPVQKKIKQERISLTFRHHLE